MMTHLQHWFVVLAVVFDSRIAEAALTVFPHQTDDFVMQLRSTILFDEKDLIGPVKVTQCSSLTDGPFCPFSREQAPLRESFSVLSEPKDSPRHVVDGIFSKHMRDQNEAAFDWDTEQLSTFSNLVSQILAQSLGGSKSPQLLKSHSTKSGAQCFRIQFNHLLPYENIVPRNFSVGLPQAFTASWDGYWEITTQKYSEDRSSHDKFSIPWTTWLRLRTVTGYLRFALPVVLRRLMIAVPANGDGKWGEGAAIYGRLKDKQVWKVALHALGSLVDPNEKRHIFHDEDGKEWTFIDVSQSTKVVDEVAFIGCSPEDGIILGLVEILVTPPSHPLHKTVPEQRNVLLLKKLQTAKVLPSTQIVARDAALWDVNEVMLHNMRLRPGAQPANVQSSVLSQPEKKASGAAKSDGKKDSSMKVFEAMLRDLKGNAFPLPSGLTMKRISSEVKILMASLEKMSDSDVLQHAAFDSLFEHKLQQQNLDGLMALHGAWRHWQRSSGRQEESEPTTESQVSEASEEVSEEASEETAQESPEEEPTQEEPATEEVEGAETEDQSAIQQAMEEVSGEAGSDSEAADTSVDEDDGSSMDWADDVVSSMSKASSDLQKKKHKMKEDLKNAEKGSVKLEFQTPKGKVQMQVMGLGQAGQKMTKLMKNAMKKPGTEDAGSEKDEEDGSSSKSEDESGEDKEAEEGSADGETVLSSLLKKQGKLLQEQMQSGNMGNLGEAMQAMLGGQVHVMNFGPNGIQMGAEGVDLEGVQGQLQEQLQQMMSGMKGSDGDESMDQGSQNEMLQKMMEQITKMANGVDDGTEHVVELEAGDLGQANEAMQNMFQQMFGGAGGSGGFPEANEAMQNMFQNMASMAQQSDGEETSDEDSDIETVEL